MEVNGPINCLVTYILKNIFYVQQKKEPHRFGTTIGLEQQEGE